MAMREQELLQLEDLYKYRSEVQRYNNAGAEMIQKAENLHMRVFNAPYEKLPTDHCAKLEKWREERIAERTKAYKRNAILIGVLGAFTGLVWIPCIIIAVWLHGMAEKWAIKKVASETAAEYRDAYEKDKEAAEENEHRQASAIQAMAEKLHPESVALAKKSKELHEALRQVLEKAMQNPLYDTLKNEGVEDIAFLIEKIQSGRADSLKEALLLLDQQRVVDEKTARELQWRLEDLEIHAAERAEDVQRAEEAQREMEDRLRSIESEVRNRGRAIEYETYKLRKELEN